MLFHSRAVHPQRQSRALDELAVAGGGQRYLQRDLKDNIQVYCRVRPVSANEAADAQHDSGQVELGFKVYVLMPRRGIEPTVAMYGTLVFAADMGAFQRVIEVRGWLRASGLEVHVTCANAYLSVLVKQVLALFQELQGGCGLAPSVTSYSHLAMQGWGNAYSVVVYVCR
ncbi:hypothetical protein PLESTM_000278100 [Pleodorina starrii]|nr:hypothetical protein PLESTM_000278100 [Pleodorina starrii]